MSLAEEIEYSEHVSRITKVTFGVLSPKTIIEQSVCEIYNHNIVPTPEPGGLLDPRMGPIDRNGENALSKLDLAHDPGNFGHINLAKPVILLQYFQQIVDTLNCVCVKCSSILLDKTESDFDKSFQKLSGKNRFLKVSELTKGIKNCPNCGTCKVIFKKDKEGIGKISALGAGEVKRISNDMDGCVSDANKVDEKERFKEFQFVDPEVCLAILKNITDDDCRLMGYVPEYTRPDSMIWGSFMPVPPPCMRPPVQSDGQINDDDLTHKLNDIVKTNNLIRNLLDSKEKQEASTGLDIVAEDEEGKEVKKSDQETKLMQDRNSRVALWWQLLQYHVATYIDNSSASIPTSTSRSGRPYKTLRERVKAKEGRIRGNLMGKRVNGSARSVITPDPNISIDQVGVPIDIATNLTFPEYVNKRNIETLTRLVMNGEKWPGAKSVKYNSISPIETPVGKCNQNFKCRLSYLTDDQRNKIKLSYGDVVDRHMMDGDIVLFNRQPSLHKMSMMGHRAKVMHKGSSFRLNISATTPYNADFDGDEMNLHYPKTPESQFEVGELCGLPYQIVSPQASKPVMGLVQDSLMASYLFPKLDHNLNVMEYMFLVGWTNAYQPYGKLLSNIDSKSETIGDVEIKNPIWKPKDVFSTFIPKLSYKKELPPPSQDLPAENLVIEDGIMKEGRFDKTTLGAKAGSLIHNVWIDFGPEPTRNLFDNLMNVTTQWLLINGFSVGLSDMLISTDADKREKGNKEVKDHVRYRLEEAKLKIDYLHRGDYPINTPEAQEQFKDELITLIGGELSEKEKDDIKNGVVFLDLAKPPYVQFERDISDVLEKARSSAEKITYNYVNEPLLPGPDGQARVGNRMNVMVDSGSKGSKINLVQIISLLGQQVIEGGRITTGGFRGRILPHFYKGNITPEASGFIQNGYLKGLNAVEYWFHAMAARIGLISTSIKTAETGYLQRRLIKAMEDLHIAYDNTVRNANDVIVQYSYGNDSFDGSRIEPVKFDYLNMSDTQFQLTYEFSKAELPILLSPNALNTLINTNDWNGYLNKEFEKQKEDRYILKNHVYRNGVPSKIYSPINFNRVIDTILYRFGLKNVAVADVDPVYIIKEVNKFLKEIIDIYAPIDGNTEKGEKTLAVIIAIFRNHLASKKLVKRKLNKLAFDYLMEQCRIYFYKAIITPGENVGVIAAQSIGEPSTQMTLDVFHSTGVGSKANVSRGVPRINEILRVAPNLKTPSLTVHINQTYLRYPNDEREEAYKRAKLLGSSLEYTVLSKLIAKVETIYDINNCTYEKDNAMIQTYYEFVDLETGTQEDSESAKNPVVLRIQFDENALNEKNITMFDIKRAVEEYDEDKKFVLIFSDDNSDELICRISVETDTGLNPITELKTLERELMKIKVKGVSDINTATVRLIDPYFYDKDDGTLGKGYNYVVDTEGVNLIDVLATTNVDYTKTTSNHILEVLEVLGVEAARATIIQELIETIESADAYVNPRHVELLADVMTIQGYIVSVDRHGSHKTDSGPLSRASFEETTLQLFNASIYSEEDPMTGVSANIMFGQCIQTGTNAFDLLFDAETALA